MLLASLAPLTAPHGGGAALLTWNRLVLLKNMKLIRDKDECSASLRETPASREAGRVT